MRPRHCLWAPPRGPAHAAWTPANRGVAPAQPPPAMGGDGHGHGFDTRSVWSPAGGWYPDPRGWRRNTALAMGAIAAASYLIASASAKLEVRAAGGLRHRVGRSQSRRRASTRRGVDAASPTAARLTGRGNARVGSRLGGVVVCPDRSVARVCSTSPPVRSLALTRLASFLSQQRPLAPVRPVPSQRWCDNFPADAKQ